MNPVVLVTDANRKLVDLFDRFLTRRGYVVDSAVDGMECMEKLRQLCPDVLVLDRNLPWGGGDGVLACLRQERPATSPAVVLTTYDADCPPELLNGSVLGCLRKPFAPPELLRSIEAALELKEIVNGNGVSSQGACKPQENARQPPDGQKPAVLVVDDDKAVRNLLWVGLEKQGFEVWLASSGTEALNLCKHQGKTFAAVLLDVCMPNLDGPQTLSALQRLAPEVPCCFMTRDPGSYGIAELLNQGVATVFAKPIRLREVGETLWQLVGEGREEVPEIAAGSADPPVACGELT